jgi:hypothetical protein
VPANTSAPDTYTVALPDGFLPAYVGTVDLKESNPVVQKWVSLAKGSGMSQEQFDQGLQLLVQANTAHIPDPAAEITKLGEHGQQRAARMINWVKSKLSPAGYQALASKGISADYVTALEELMSLAGEPKFAAAGAVPPTQLTRTDVQKMMEDERYWRAKDPKYIADVEAAWKQVVGPGVLSTTKTRSPGRDGRAA